MKVFKLFLLAILLPGVGLLAQHGGFEGGIILGTSSYSGDVNPAITPRAEDLSLSVGFGARSSLSRKFNFRGSFTAIKLQGDDANFAERGDRNFKFRSTLYELGTALEWEPFGKDRYYADARGNRVFQPLISPYFYSGLSIAFASLNPDFSNYKGNSESIRTGILRDQQNGNTAFVAAIPVGMGVKYDLTERLVLALDATFRMTLSDYVDGISLSAGPNSRDTYSTLNMMVFYRFNFR